MITFKIHYRYETRLIAGDGVFEGSLTERASPDFDLSNFTNKLQDMGFTVTRIDRSDETQQERDTE